MSKKKKKTSLTGLVPGFGGLKGYSELDMSTGVLICRLYMWPGHLMPWQVPRGSVQTASVSRDWDTKEEATSFLTPTLGRHTHYLCCILLIVNW
jgi:hypothetical protein